MKKIWWLGSGLIVGAMLLCSCEWTSNVDTWSESQFGTNAAVLDFSGVYKAEDGGFLVRGFGEASATNQVVEEQIATGNGSSTAFAGALSHVPVGGTLTIIVGAYRFTDTGSTGTGTFNLQVAPNDGSFGTVNYATRAWTLNFPAPIAKSTPLLANYSYIESQGNVGKPIYSFVVYQTGDHLQIIDNNNSRYEGRIGLTANTQQAQFSVSGVSQGHNVTIAGMFQRQTRKVQSPDGDDAERMVCIMNATFIEENGFEGDIRGLKLDPQDKEEDT